MPIQELYARNAEDDDNFRDDLLEVSSTLETYLQQIRAVFTTEPGSVMGAVTMGLDLEAEVYEHQISDRVLETKIVESLQNFCTLYPQFETACRVRFGQGTERDIVVIEISVDGKPVFATQLR